MTTEDQLQTLPKAVDGLVFACILDGSGGATKVGWDEVKKKWHDSKELIWVHLDRSSDRTQQWLEDDARLPSVTTRALLEQETRPRLFASAEGHVAILRGINLNAGADPDDMVVLRIYVTEHRLITVRHRPLMTPRDMLAELTDRKSGPASIPELFVRLTERLTERMNSAVVNLDETLDDIEEQLESGQTEALRSRLIRARQTAVALRRYIGPQREAVARLQIERPRWMNKHLESLIREAAEKLQRYVEDLDAARDRAIVVSDEISNRLADGLNRRMYALSIIAGIFLPLSFLTGLLGINVGGMPGVDSASAFMWTCVFLVVILVVEVYIFRRMKWI